MSVIATAVEMRAKMHKSPELLAKYQQTLNYRSALALKGVRTRKRNQAAANSNTDPNGEPDTDTSSAK